MPARGGQCQKATTYTAAERFTLSPEPFACGTPGRLRSFPGRPDRPGRGRTASPCQAGEGHAADLPALRLKQAAAAYVSQDACAGYPARGSGPAGPRRPGDSTTKGQEGRSS